MGLLLYIASQLVGSTLALQYLRAGKSSLEVQESKLTFIFSEYVAPLGSASLIFNFIFARILTGVTITKLDYIGTLVIIAGVVGVVGFSNIRSSGDADFEFGLDLDILSSLWGRGPWIAYIVIMEVVVCSLLWLAHIMDQIVKEREELESVEEWKRLRREKARICSKLVANLSIST